MINEIKLLTKVQMCNFFGINEAKYSKDKTKRNRLYSTAIGLLIFGAMIAFYFGNTTFLLITFGMENFIPKTVGLTISGLTFTLTLFRAGPTLFNVKSYEKTVCLPVKTTSVVISRFLNLYIYNTIFNIFITGSAVAVCIYCGKSSIMFYPTMILGTFILPLLPLTLSVVIGTIGYYFASRVQKKNLMSILWYIAIFAVIFLISFSNTNTEIPDEETIGQLTESMTQTSNFYPILNWFSDGVNGDILKYLLFSFISIVVTAALLTVISKFYNRICIGLSSTAAKRNYKMTKQITRSVSKTLYLREVKRYFSSAVYVMNTILGFIFAAAFGILLAVLGIESLCEELGIPSEMLARILPIIIGMCCNTMPTTAASISIEGKNFWLMKSLPISMRNLANAKISVNLTFAIPACIIASTAICLSLKAGIIDSLFIFIIPLTVVIFGSVFGLYMNISNPMMEWESEAVPIKQSKSGLMTMLILFLCEFAAMIICFIMPNDFGIIAILTVIILFMLGAFLLYRKISKTDIKTIV